MTDIWHFLGGVVGGLIGTSAFALLFGTTLKERWIEKVRASYALQLEAVKDSFQHAQKASQARIDRSVFVSRTQFDAEFKAMQDIFRYATETWIPLQGLRPRFDIRPPNQSQEESREVMWIRWKRLAEAFEIFQTQIEVLSPFYPATLYAALNKCRLSAQVELVSVQTAGSTVGDPGWFEEGAENSREFTEAYREAASIIRERLDQLAVVD